MQIRTPFELGLVIRDQRRKLKLTQTDLARKIGVGRQWIIAVERGKFGAEVGLVLRALSALDLPVEIGAPLPRSGDKIDPVDIDAILNAAKGA